MNITVIRGHLTQEETQRLELGAGVLTKTPVFSCILL